jgi:hypothetical protein
MIQKKKKNNKAVLFFILLVLVGYVFVNFGQSISSKGEVKAEYEEKVVPKPEECTTCGATVEEEIVSEEPEVAVVMVDEKYTVDVTEEVLALDDIWNVIINFPTCNAYDPAQGLNSTTRLCSEGGTQFPMDKASLGGALKNLIFGGNNVKVDAITDVELTQVTYPLAFFLGQFVIKNSNREASMESPNYPSNGQIIDKNYTLKTHAPAEAEEYSEFLEETVRQDYEVSATINVPKVDTNVPEGEEEEGEYGVMNVDDAECACEEEEVSNSDYNPGSPNRQGYAGGGWSRQQAPDGDNYEPPELEQCLELNKDYKMMLFGNVVACYDIFGTVAGKLKGLVSKTFGTGEWDNCNDTVEVCVTDAQGNEVCREEEATGECMNSLELGVQMTPIFGDPYECKDELCANAYLTNSYKSGLAPAESDRKSPEAGSTEDSLMFFVGTPCKANVTAGSTRNVGVTCLWDVSPYLLDYKLQKTFEAPNDEEFPETFEIYWDLVMQAMELSADYYGLSEE